MANIVALIPARSGSKGVLDKNIKLLEGRPLLAWTIAASLRADNIDRVIVSTDSQEYARIAKECGAEAPFLRPEEISADQSTDYEFIAHALDWLAANAKLPQFIVHMRPTTPLRKPDLVAMAIESFIATPQATALRSVHEMPESAYKTFELSNFLGSNSRKDEFKVLKQLGRQDTNIDSANIGRQQFPSTYQANGYVDVLSTEFIQKNRMLHGDRVLPFITPTVVEVDTMDDFNHLEFLSKNNPEFIHALFE
ncbi:MAG: acylneuraminate cytidylyltransferase family protein [Magnetococcales bacterium]|nr:acylneuraminate cytidylyltransferase family protein [Magnetococcales bacterium]